MKREPSYWWDFDDNGTMVIIQSDQEGGECLAKCEFVDEAETIIDNLKTGRLTLKALKENNHE